MPRTMLVAALVAVAVCALLPLAAWGSSTSVCVSSGDTHMYPFGGQQRFDIYNPRPFILTAYRTNDHNRRFEVQATQAYGAWGGRTVDNDLAVRCGRDLIVFRQHRNGNEPTITVNGRQHSIGSGSKFFMPSAPASSRDRYFIYASHNQWWHTYQIDCNHRGYESEYAFGMKTAVQWYRPFNHPHYRRIGASRYVHGNVQVEVQTRYAWQLESGACGFRTDRRQPAHLNHIIEYRTSLFSKTPADHAREAKAGAKVSDPKALADASARCARGIYQATGVSLEKAREYFERLDKNVPTTIANFIRGCAIDLYFGVGHNMDDMAASVCSWVSLANDAVYQDTVRTIHSIRKCEKPYVEPSKLLPMLEEKFRLAQFCNRNPPKQRDALPTGLGFNPTCQQIEAQRAKIHQLSDEQRAKAAALSKRGEEQKAEAQREATAKALERAKLEEETKKIEKEKAETEALEQKAREDLQKREAARASGAKVPMEKDDGPNPGTKMSQKSKVFISDATGVTGAATDKQATAAKPSEESSEESSAESSEASSEESSEASSEESTEESSEESTAPTPVF